MQATTSTSNKNHKGILQRAASYASLSVALILVGAKLWGWLSTDSVSVLSSLADSFLDVLGSGITVVAIRMALMPADSEHRFGHGKSEGLAALMQSIIISISAFYVLLEAVYRLAEPQPVKNPEAGIAVMLLSIVITLGLLAFQRSVIKKTKSLAIAADAMHYRSDLMVNISVVIALLLSIWTNWTIVDPLIGIGIAAYILWSTYDIAAKALDVLLDRELPLEERQKIATIAKQHPKVMGFHDLRTRSGGTHHIIQFHLELDPNSTLIESHLIMDAVEDEIRKLYPSCEIIVHADPLGFEEIRDKWG
ncbi:MAG: cation diffusion facilitator family transporter [Gammaproteobacteria bacterium]|nr:cation diffusion facilitator family transporter [Gammaproteobacteria bacterium]MCP4091178.1 cation diffusion facilitator family transporter [Gammaproteobacteria bacterium]MCP4278357.1 cation diffusion facilitator family transporter [Gammaproteobacteria bacterium]MCP4831643.1 cation diffusion facilitator family transporter [Gammaproteobacteria bacterium]MCP4927866.1 cation diffusion facilitator family transporter [Gammaproteobacteria bacterium]